MTHYCKYHVLELADWHCPLCRVEFCSTCSPDLPGEEVTVHYCPLCNGELRRLGAAHSAPPFWQRLTDFLRYPFSPLGLVLLVLAFVLPLLFATSDFIAYGVGAAVLLVVGKYAWTALEQAATGDLVPIGPERLAKADNNELAFGVSFVLVGLSAATGYVFLKSAFYGTVLAVLVLAVVPALIIASGSNRSFNAGLSGDGLKTALAGVGPVYAGIALMSVLLFAALQSFVSIFADILPLAWGRAAALTAYSYFLIVLMVLCGYVLFQFQEQLGYTPAGGAERRKTHKRGDPLMIAMEMFLKEGNYAKVTSMLKSESQKKSANLTTHERYHKLIWMMNDETALRQHANVYFKVLLETGRDTQAVSLMRAYNQRIPGFRPEDPDVCLDLAESFERAGDYKLAVHVLNGLHKDAPHYARLPEAYLMAARLLAEKLALPQKGLALVQFLDGRFKTHKSYPDIQQALRSLTAQVKTA
jgi:hypothetical protein